MAALKPRDSLSGERVWVIALSSLYLHTNDSNTITVWADVPIATATATPPNPVLTLEDTAAPTDIPASASPPAGSPGSPPPAIQRTPPPPPPPPRAPSHKTGNSNEFNNAVPTRMATGTPPGSPPLGPDTTSSVVPPL